MLRSSSSMSSRRLQMQHRPTCNGYVCLYTCQSEFTQQISGLSNGTDEIQQKDSFLFTLYYDYEIYAKLNVDLHLAISHLESNVLSFLATKLNLDDCDLFKGKGQFEFGGGYDWIYPYIGNSVDEQLTYDNDVIYSLSSTPTDQIDTDYIECSAAVAVVPEQTACIPIRGRMRIQYVGNEEDASFLSEAVLNHIERGSTNDWFVTDDIPKVVFLGTRSRDAPSAYVSGSSSSYGDIINANGGGKEKSFTLSSVVTGLIVIATVVIFIGFLLLMKKLRKRRSNKNMIFTPSPKVGKRKGLRTCDAQGEWSTSSQSDSNKPQSTIDPYEYQPKPAVSNQTISPRIILENPVNYDDDEPVTNLSAITEGSKETGSSSNESSTPSYRRIMSDYMFSPPSPVDEGLHGESYVGTTP